MKRVFAPICLVVGHKRQRRRVWSDGSRWRCTCSRCGAELVKSHSGASWHRLDESERGRA